MSWSEQSAASTSWSESTEERSEFAEGCGLNESSGAAGYGTAGCMQAGEPLPNWS